MRALAQWLEEFVQREDGPTPVEYALMLFLLGVVCFGGIRSLGTGTRGKVNEASTMMRDAGS